MPENDGVISLITNFKILPYSYCTTVLSQMFQALNKKNTVYAVMHRYIGTLIGICCVNIAALRIMMYHSIVTIFPSLP